MDEPQASHIDHVRFLRRVIVNRWPVITLAFLLIALPTVAWVVFYAPNMYEASATLLFVSSKEEPAYLRDFLSPEVSALYLAILKSRSLAQAVADSLPRESREELLQHTTLRDYLLAIGNAIRRFRGQEVVVYSPQERVVRELQEMRTSFHIAKDGTVTITTLAFSPRVAVDLANTYVEVLLTRSGSYSRDQARTARELIEGFLLQARTNQLEAEGALRKFQTQTGGGVKLSDRSSLELNRLSQFENLLADIQINKEIAQAKLTVLRGADKDQPQPGGAVDPGIQTLRERFAKLEARLSGLTDKYTDQHPLVIATREEIQEVQDRLRASLQGQELPRLRGLVQPAERAALVKQIADLEVELTSLSARETQLQQRTDQIKRSLSTLGSRELEYSQHIRAVEGQRSLLSLLSEKLTAARINEQGQIRSIRVIDQAALPREPSSRRWMTILLLGLAAGLGLGVGAGAVIEYRRDVIETEEDVLRVSGLPVLGSIPLVGRRGSTRGRHPSPVRASSTRRHRDGPMNFLDGNGSFPLPAEAYRTIRSALESLGGGRGPKTLLVTSAGAGEGKTTAVVNLGWAFWETSRRVLLVDADLRRPALHRALQIPNEVGLANLVRDGAAWGEGCQAVRDGLELIPSGSARSNPAALLSPRHVEKLLKVARERAEVILTDSPPVLAVADQLGLAAQVDGTILVVRSGVTRRRSLLRAKARLEQVHARVLGVVVNGLSPRETQRHYAEYAHYMATPRT